MAPKLLSLLQQHRVRPGHCSAPAGFRLHLPASGARPASPRAPAVSVPPRLAAVQTELARLGEAKALAWGALELCDQQLREQQAEVRPWHVLSDQHPAGQTAHCIAHWSGFDRQALSGGSRGASWAPGLGAGSAQAQHGCSRPAAAAEQTQRAGPRPQAGHQTRRLCPARPRQPPRGGSLC